MSQLHVLITTDLSPESTRAFAPTARMAARLGARITVLHALPHASVSGAGFPTGAGPSDAHLAEAIGAARKRLRELVAEAFGGVAPEARVETGSEVVEIVRDFAKLHGVDLIAMATHGRSGLRRVLMGSVAERVLRGSSIPVLLFPAGEPGAGPR